MKVTKMFPIITMLLVVLMGGCKKDEETGERPEITSTDPINEATSVSINHKVSASFSMEMEEATITTANFTLNDGSANIAGSVEYTGSTALFTPSEDLEPSTLYTATISTGAKNLLGRSLVGDYVWSFTTGIAADITLPTVTATDPASAAVGVAVDKLVSITFSEPMDPSTIVAANFTFKQGTTNVAGEITYSGTTAIFTPENDLEGDKVYSVSIKTGATDMAGNALAANHNFSFTTGIAPDTELPRINAFLPLSNAVDVNVDTVVVITFSEAMQSSTITTTSFTLMQGTTVVAGTVTYVGVIATFNPTNDLVFGTSYTAAINVTALDLAGNALASKTEWIFTTENAPDVVVPTVLSYTPLANAIDVDLNQVLTATFSEEMNASTINNTSFSLREGTTVIDGSVTYVGTTATFTPTLDLEKGLTYTATVNTDAEDLAGNAIANNTVWSFTTLAPTFTLDPVLLGTAGDYVILAKTAINNSSTSAITGDLALSPAATSFITGLALTDATGYATSSQVVGKVYAADMAEPTPTLLTTSVENMITAYNDAAGRPTPDFSELNTGEIGGLTLTPGLYKWTSTVTLSNDVTISGGANDVWIFQISEDLTQSAAVNITLVGGAQAKNIFWQVAGAVTVGTTAHFEGIILSQTGITFQTGASMNGRALAQTAVILDSNAITESN